MSTEFLEDTVYATVQLQTRIHVTADRPTI